MPLTGTRDLGALAAEAPLLPSLDTEPWLVTGARVLQVLYEIDQAEIVTLLPRSLHPTIPPCVFFTFHAFPDSELGSFTLAEARVGCRMAARPRSLLLRAYCDNDAAIARLRDRWGFPVQPADVRLESRYDWVRGTVEVEGRLVLDASIVDPNPISGSDVQYLPNVNLARIERDGAILPRLLQVDADYTFHKADRGEPRLDAFDADAWLMPDCRPYWPVSASCVVADVTFPKLRYLADPNKTPLESLEKL